MADSLAPARQAMLDLLRRRGIADQRVLDAMAAVPRERFVPADRQAQAYADGPLPIGDGQTISQPLIVAEMLAAAAIQPDDRVLEVGAGSGYAAALLSRLTGETYAIERLPALADRARATLAALGCAVELRDGDGTLGWPEAAPFDAMVVSAGGPAVPPALADQLAPGGRLVIPVGPPGAQRLLVLTRTATGVEERDLGLCAFVPLIGEGGWPA